MIGKCSLTSFPFFVSLSLSVLFLLLFLYLQRLVEESAAEGRALQGSLFWNWEVHLLNSPGTYEIDEGDSTFKLVKAHAARMKEIMAAAPAFPCAAQA